jgi:hypothetical protein
MKTYIFTLTDEAQAEPARFLPFIESELAAQGCRNFQYLTEVGCITADFPGERTFGPINGIGSAEESVDCTTQA